MYPRSMLRAKIRKNIFHLKIIIFAAVKNCSLLHGHVRVIRFLPHVIAYLKFGSDARECYHKILCVSTILKDAPCAQGTCICVVVFCR